MISGGKLVCFAYNIVIDPQVFGACLEVSVEIWKKNTLNWFMDGQTHFIAPLWHAQMSLTLNEAIYNISSFQPPFTNYFQASRTYRTWKVL